MKLFYTHVIAGYVHVRVMSDPGRKQVRCSPIGSTPKQLGKRSTRPTAVKGRKRLPFKSSELRATGSAVVSNVLECHGTEGTGGVHRALNLWSQSVWSEQVSSSVPSMHACLFIVSCHMVSWMLSNLFIVSCRKVGVLGFTCETVCALTTVSNRKCQVRVVWKALDQERDAVIECMFFHHERYHWQAFHTKTSERKVCIEFAKCLDPDLDFYYFTSTHDRFYEGECLDFDQKWVRSTRVRRSKLLIWW